MVYKAIQFLEITGMPPACPVVHVSRPPSAALAGWAIAAALVFAAQARRRRKPRRGPRSKPPRRRCPASGTRGGGRTGPIVALTVIRFLTETDYPPFNFTGPDGNPAGFNVDLARALCDEIKVTCTIQMRRFETLIDAITTNRGDAIIASMAVTPELRARVDFTDPYYRAPARFVSRRDAVMPEVRPEYLEGKKVGVIAGTSHEAYLKAMFTDAEINSYRH